MGIHCGAAHPQIADTRRSQVTDRIVVSQADIITVELYKETSALSFVPSFLNLSPTYTLFFYVFKRFFYNISHMIVSESVENIFAGLAIGHKIALTKDF